MDDAGVRALAEVLRPVQSGPASAWAFPCPALRYLNVGELPLPHTFGICFLYNSYFHRYSAQFY